MKSKKTSVFFFANLPVKGIEISYGGATVLAQQIFEFLKKQSCIVINQQPIRTIWKPKWHLLEHFLWVIRFPFVIRKHDVVSFHTTWDFNLTSAPLVWLWAKWLRKRTVYHFFGSDFHIYFQRLPKVLQYLYKKTILSSDTVFIETLEGLHFFESQGFSNCVWLPNSRNSILQNLPEKTFSKRFVFISRVIPEKGIEEILKISEKLPVDYLIDIYGPIDPRYLSSEQLQRGCVSYKGTLQPEEVLPILQTYDILLLPTYFASEGYPGIVIEAMSLGIPSITTRWKSIPEIINHTQNGYLIDIKNPEQLEQAIRHFTPDNYQIYRKNAFESFKNFDSKTVFNKLLKSYGE